MSGIVQLLPELPHLSVIPSTLTVHNKNEEDFFMKKNQEIVFCKDTHSSKLDFCFASAGREIDLFTTKYFSCKIYNRYKSGQRPTQILNDSANVRQQKFKENKFCECCAISLKKNRFFFPSKQENLCLKPMTVWTMKHCKAHKKLSVTGELFYWQKPAYFHLVVAF